MLQSVVCSKCSMPAKAYLDLECKHFLCVHCFDRYMKSEKIQGDDILFRCQVCLKSQRIASMSNFNMKAEHAANHNYPTFKQKLERVRHPTEQLYCFTCQSQTFTTYDYIRGQHRGHRVKTYNEAIIELKDMHIRSMSILEHKHDELSEKQHQLQYFLKELSHEYTHSQQLIMDYYDSVIQKINRKRKSILNELEQHHRQISIDVTRNIDVVHSHVVDISKLTDILKEFYAGRETINNLVRCQQKLSNYLSIKTNKYVPQQLPKVIETIDLEFHIDNSLRIMREMYEPEVEMEYEEIQEMPRRRTVKLVEKVRSKLNSTCDFYIK